MKECQKSLQEPVGSTLRALPKALLPPLPQPHDLEYSLPFLCEKSSSLEELHELYPTTSEWLSQFANLKVAFVGKGPYAQSGKNVEQQLYDIVIKQVPLLTSYDRLIEEVHLLQKLQETIATVASTGRALMNVPKYIGHYFDGSVGFIAFQAIHGLSLVSAGRLAQGKFPRLSSDLLVNESVMKTASVQIRAAWSNIVSSIEQQVKFMHSINLAHKDLHEYNVILEPLTLKPWIIDFGRAKFNASEVDCAEDNSAVADLYNLLQTEL